MKRTAKYTPRRLNRYVPAMGYSVDVIHGAPHDVRFGPVAIGDADNILDGEVFAAAATVTTFLQDNTDPINSSYTEEFPLGPGFGRCLQFVASGANTSTVTVKGRDYLGQPMLETITLNGTTPVIGTKAFKWIDSIATSAAATIDVGTTDKLGLPYRMKNVLTETSSGVRQGTLGTLVTPSLTDPATATTTDPRGTYDPTTTLDGTAYIAGVFIPNGDLNSSGNGGLYGLAHYTA